MSILIYGAYGYTGELIVDEAIRRDLKPILAGRDAGRMAELANRTGLEVRVCSLDDEAGLVSMLRGIELVIHAAGPFTVTSKPMGKACLEAGAHYLDITGEIPVFEKLAAIDHKARERGIMMMPGVGFDVVPSDCLAAHLKRRLETGNRLELAIGTDGGGLSRGTTRTMLRHAGLGGIERVAGTLVSAPVGRKKRVVDFGAGPKQVISIPWGDLASAFRSTGVPDITCYASYPTLMRVVATRLHWIAPVFRSMPVQAVLNWGVSTLMAPGPNEQVRSTARSLVWGEMSDAEGRSVRSRISGPEGYALTAITAVDIAMRALGGAAEPGFRTPSMVFGPDYPLTLGGFVREDLE